MSLSAEERKKIGGSDVAAIVGVSPYGGPLSVWLRIVHGDEREDSPHLSRGRRLEPVVLDWYAETTGRRVTRNHRLTLQGKPHLRASFDALAYGERAAVRVVEAKTANGNEAHRWGEEGTDAIPPEYLCQSQWYLGAGLGAGLLTEGVCDVPALVAGDFRLYSVAYDEETYGLLSESVERFWTDHVLTGRPPEPTALPNDAEAVRRRFHRDTAGHLDFSALDAEAQAALYDYLRAYNEAKGAEERLMALETRAKFVVGEFSGVRGLPEELGYHRLDWQAQKGKTAWKQVAQALAKKCGLTEAQLSALASENTGEGSRPFTPRPLRREAR